MQPMRITILFFLSLWLYALPVIGQASGTYAEKVHQFRDDHEQKLMRDNQGPLTEEQIGKLDYFPPDSGFVVQADFIRTPNAESVKLTTFQGKELTYLPYGHLFLKMGGRRIKLTVYQNLVHARMPTHRDKLLLPFTDLTNGESTYGGGRYLDLSTTDIQDRKLTVDFNRAYNPFCAYDNKFVCPMPPRENHLPVKVEAGEKHFAGKE